MTRPLIAKARAEVGRAGGAERHGAAVSGVLAVVQDGWQVSEVARRLGVSRQTVHVWIRRYEAGGLVGYAESSRPIAS